MKDIKVKNIVKADNKDYMKMTVTYGENLKEYTFIRRAYQSSKNPSRYTMVIEGQRIKFDFFEDSIFTVVSQEQIYETTRKRKSTVGNAREENEVEEPTVIMVEELIEDKNEDEIPEVEDGEVKHEQYETIKTCLEANIPVYLAGPAGSGKNFTVEQIANELGWNFYFSNSIQQEFKLTGFIDAGGNYHETEFSKACKDGNDCIFFLDEIDASIPEVLVLLNAAIANGYFEFPTGRVNLEHVHFVAAGNTVGSGADELYTGRLVLDQATLDRFAIIEFDYSMNIEMSITNNNRELVNYIRDLRKQAKEYGIRATFSYRCMTMVTKLEKTNMNLDVILKIAVFKGLDNDTINTFNAISIGKYYEGLRKIQRAA